MADAAFCHDCLTPFVGSANPQAASTAHPGLCQGCSAELLGRQVPPLTFSERLALAWKIPADREPR